MDKLLLFFAGVFFTNGIPHFINGISGKPFVKPFLYRFFPFVPNPMFNVIWGMISFVLAAILWNIYQRLHPHFILKVGMNLEFIIVAVALVSVSIGLSLFFMKGDW